jgi:hypothetical protein
MNRLVRWWGRSVIQLRVYWLSLAGQRLERRILEERKRYPSGSPSSGD